MRKGKKNAEAWVEVSQVQSSLFHAHLGQLAGSVHRTLAHLSEDLKHSKTRVLTLGMSRIKTHAGGSLCPAATSRLFAKTSAIHIRTGKPGRLAAKEQKYVMFNSGSIKFYNCFLSSCLPPSYIWPGFQAVQRTTHHNFSLATPWAAVDHHGRCHSSRVRHMGQMLLPSSWISLAVEMLQDWFGISIVLRCNGFGI